jgi:O-glycosyl hydrolase
MRSSIIVLISVLAFPGLWTPTVQAQDTAIIDQFNPSGANGFSYSGGQINKVWTNWFGTSFQSLVWDSGNHTNDPDGNASGGSMKITAIFNSTSNQFEVYDGNNGITPALNGFFFTNFQCDVMFGGSSPTTTINGTNSFGYLQFGVQTSGFGQDYFGAAVVPSSNTGWVHVSLPINALSDANLQAINDVLIHIYGPADSPSLSGTTTLWVDNIEFTGPTLTNAVTIDWNNVHQRIDGYGASSAWFSPSEWQSYHTQMFFSTNSGTGTTLDGRTNFAFNGIGLSFLRSHIDYANNTSANTVLASGETAIMKDAVGVGLGVRVWSTPWTPAAGFKSTNDLYDSGKATGGGIDGGSYLGLGNNATNLAYASQVANYVSSVASSIGTNLYAISVQNEPNADVTSYEACQWNGQMIHDFVTNLYAALQSKGAGSTKIIIPESESWSSDTALFTNALEDTNVAPEVSIVADHDYVGNNLVGDTTIPPQTTSAKPLWETEVSQIGGNFDGSITNGVYWAGRIHDFMVYAQANAYHYWWLISENSDNEGLTDNNGYPAKRMYAFGQFSRFVRPNYYRIDANNGGFAEISAYKDSVSSNFAIVAINPYSTNITQVFNLTNFTVAGSLTPWMTTSNQSIVAQSAIANPGSSFSYTLPALSIVTFTGQGNTNAIAVSPPVFTAVSPQTVNAGVTVRVTNTATASDVPPYSITYSPANTFPNNATVNSTSGVFNWRPSVSQANTTNVIQVAATDNDSFDLGATNTFSIIVNAITNPVLGTANGSEGTVSYSQGQFNMSITGPQGPDYTVLMSSNLVNWQPIFTTNSPALPFIFTDTNAVNRNQYYEIQIGP